MRAFIRPKITGWNALGYLGTAQPSLCFKETLRGCLAVVRWATWNGGEIMAQSDRQGTGRHPHKSTEEPYPHTKDNQGEGEHRSRSSQASHSGGSERSSRSSRDDESNRSSHGSRASESARSEPRGAADAGLK